MKQQATKGRIVLFKHDRETALQAGGNSHAGDIVPAMIVVAWQPNYVNLKVFTDGPNDIWVTSVIEWEPDGVVSRDGLQPQRTYRWPERG